MNRTFVLGLAFVVGVAASLCSAESFAQNCCYDSGARRTFRVRGFRARRTACYTPVRVAQPQCCNQVTPVSDCGCATTVAHTTVAPVSNCNTCATNCNTCNTCRPVVARRVVRANRCCNNYTSCGTTCGNTCGTTCGTCNNNCGTAVASNCGTSCGTCNTCNTCRTRPIVARRVATVCCNPCNSTYTTTTNSGCCSGCATAPATGTPAPQPADTKEVTPPAPESTQSDT